MGIQVYFKLADAEKAGIVKSIGEEKTVDCACCPACYESEPCTHPVTFDAPVLLESDGVSVTVGLWNNGSDERELVCDFNHWGSNRPRLEPMLKKHGIPYTEA